MSKRTHFLYTSVFIICFVHNNPAALNERELQSQKWKEKRVKIIRESRLFQTFILTKMGLADIMDVEIEAGTFKYVYIRVYEDAGGDDRWKHSVNTSYPGMYII